MKQPSALELLIKLAAPSARLPRLSNVANTAASMGSAVGLGKAFEDLSEEEQQAAVDRFSSEYGEGIESRIAEYDVPAGMVSEKPAGKAGEYVLTELPNGDAYVVDMASGKVFLRRKNGRGSGKTGIVADNLSDFLEMVRSARK